MKLDRNENVSGRGKYALILMRKLAELEGGTFGGLPANIEAALQLLDDNGLIDWGARGSESEFFVTRLKDRYAPPSLHAYANAAWIAGDDEWAREVADMAQRAEVSPWKKRPD